MLGVAGLVGAGRSELLTALFGGHPGKTTGSIFMEGPAITVRTPADALERGIGFVTEDRKRFGLMLDQTLVNMTLASLERFGTFLTDTEVETASAEESRRDMRIKASSVFVEGMTLSWPARTL